MRNKALSGCAMTTLASVLALYCSAVWADGPQSAYGDEEAPVASLSPDEYQLNADGMKEDPQAKMSDVARAYRNGYINRGKEDQASYDAMIDSHNHGQRKPTNTNVARVDVPPLPAGVPEDDSSTYTTIPPQPRQSAQRQASVRQAAAQTSAQPAARPIPPVQYQQVYQPQPPQPPRYAQMPAQYQPMPVYAQPQPVYADSQPVYVREDYSAPVQPVQYIPVYAQQSYEEPIIETIVQPVAPPVAYQTYRAPVYLSTTPRVYSYRTPMVGYQVWR